MPEMMNFKVTQIREVEVVANSTVDALRIAADAFEHGQTKSESSLLPGHGPAGVWGNTRSRIKETNLSAERK